MKPNQRMAICTMLVLFLALALQTRADDAIDKEVQRRVEQLSTVNSKIEYLSSLIAEKNDSSDITNNILKSSAIILLGEIGGTNVIDMLVTNLAYLDKRNNGYPASRALVLIGEPAVTQLLNVLINSGNEEPQETVEDMRAKLANGYKESNDEIRIRLAAETIGFIERKNWIEFLKKQKKTLPKKAWDRLNRYAIIIS